MCIRVSGDSSTTKKGGTGVFHSPVVMSKERGGGVEEGEGSPHSSPPSSPNAAASTGDHQSYRPARSDRTSAGASRRSFHASTCERVNRLAVHPFQACPMIYSGHGPFALPPAPIGNRTTVRRVSPDFLKYGVDSSGSSSVMTHDMTHTGATPSAIVEDICMTASNWAEHHLVAGPQTGQNASPAALTHALPVHHTVPSGSSSVKSWPKAHSGGSSSSSPRLAAPQALMFSQPGQQHAAAAGPMAPGASSDADNPFIFQGAQTHLDVHISSSYWPNNCSAGPMTALQHTTLPRSCCTPSVAAMEGAFSNQDNSPFEYGHFAAPAAIYHAAPDSSCSRPLTPLAGSLVSSSSMRTVPELHQQLAQLQLHASSNRRNSSSSAAGDVVYAANPGEFHGYFQEEPLQPQPLGGSYSCPLSELDAGATVQQQVFGRLGSCNSISTPLPAVLEPAEQHQLQTMHVIDGQLMKLLQLRDQATAHAAAQAGPSGPLSGPAAAAVFSATASSMHHDTVKHATAVRAALQFASVVDPTPTSSASAPAGGAGLGAVSAAHMELHQQQQLGHQLCMSAAAAAGCSAGPGAHQQGSMNEAAQVKLQQLMLIQQWQMDLQEELLQLLPKR